jgi:hypothetical protein
VLLSSIFRRMELDQSTPLPFADAVEYQQTSGSDNDSIRWFLPDRGGPKERTIDRLKRTTCHARGRAKPGPTSMLAGFDLSVL